MMFVFFLGAAAAGLTTAHVSNMADDGADVHTIAKEASPLLEGDPHPIDWLAVEVSEVSYSRYTSYACAGIHSCLGISKSGCVR